MGDFEENVFAFSMISIMEFIHDFSKNYIIYLGHVAIHGGLKIMDYILLMIEKDKPHATCIKNNP